MPAPIPANENVTSNPLSVLDYQFHQVAIFTDSIEKSIAPYINMGYDNWIIDTADLVGVLNGEETVTEATMAFNYDIMPMELEFLHYEGPNRHSKEGRDGSQPFISHMSVYVDDVKESSVKIFQELGLLPYHRFITDNNTNPAVRGVKRFIECIYDTRADLGYDLKLIQKVAWDYKNSEWLDFCIQSEEAGDMFIDKL